MRWKNVNTLRNNEYRFREIVKKKQSYMKPASIVKVTAVFKEQIMVKNAA